MKKWYMMILVGLVLVFLTGCGDLIPQGGADTETSSQTTTSPDNKDTTSQTTTSPDNKDTTSQTTTSQDTGKHTDPHLDNFRGVLGANDFCAAAYLGYLDGSYYEILAHIEDLGVLEAFPFLEIPKENYIGMVGGELYVIVPADPDATVTVCSAVLDEADYTVTAGQQLAYFTGGAPILLKCNVSEIVPNVVLQITVDGKTTTYSPSLSGENGQLVQTEGVYDFSPYDVLFDDTEDEAGSAVGVFCDKWLTTERNPAGDPVVMLLNLLPDGTAEYAYGIANSEFSEKYAGTWSYDAQKDMLRLVLEEVQNDENAGPVRKLNCAFTWEIDDIYFKLTHVEGDELLDGLWGGTFLFLNGNDFDHAPKG